MISSRHQPILCHGVSLLFFSRQNVLLQRQVVLRVRRPALQSRRPRLPLCPVLDGLPVARGRQPEAGCCPAQPRRRRRRGQVAVGRRLGDAPGQSGPRARVAQLRVICCAPRPAATHARSASRGFFARRSLLLFLLVFLGTRDSTQRHGRVRSH